MIVLHFAGIYILPDGPVTCRPLFFVCINFVKS